MKNLENYTAEELLSIEAEWEDNWHLANNYAEVYKEPAYGLISIKKEIAKRLKYYDELIKEKEYGF